MVQTSPVFTLSLQSTLSLHRIVSYSGQMVLIDIQFHIPRKTHDLVPLFLETLSLLRFQGRYLFYDQSAVVHLEKRHEFDISQALLCCNAGEMLLLIVLYIMKWKPETSLVFWNTNVFLFYQTMQKYQPPIKSTQRNQQAKILLIWYLIRQEQKNLKDLCICK